MSKITFLHDDPTYGKQVSVTPTPEAILVPQGKYTHLLYGISLIPESEEAEGDNEMHMPMPEHYEAERIELLGMPDYPSIVSAIIRSRYSSDEVEAIVLNHGDGNKDHEKEYVALQEWRSEAKRIAKIVIL